MKAGRKKPSSSSTSSSSGSKSGTPKQKAQITVVSDTECSSDSSSSSSSSSASSASSASSSSATAATAATAVAAVAAAVATPAATTKTEKAQKVEKTEKAQAQTQSTKAKSALETTYQKKSELEHVLDNPDTYIGSVHKVDVGEFVVDADARIRSRDMQLVPGLYKLFDEGIVNCRDHAVRMDAAEAAAAAGNRPAGTVRKVTQIKVTVDKASGLITMYNDGNGIDVAEHPEHKVWIPELIFGHMRTSTNYKKDEKRIVGGKNGFGFKLVLIWSKHGTVETVDHQRGKKYTQTFRDNLSLIEPPKITSSRQAPYTCVSFLPDYERLGLPGGLSDDMVALLHRRTYDIAAITDHKVNVWFNGEKIPLGAPTKTITLFERYINTFSFDKLGDANANEHNNVDDDDDAKSVASSSASTSSTSPKVKKVYERPNERWEFAVTMAPENSDARHVSFVNGIYTSKGGKHVEFVLNKIVRKLVAYINEKKKTDVKPAAVKDQLMLFLRCDIDNPSFDSQTKDYMNTPSNVFGSTCEVSDDFVKKLAKMGVMDVACAIAHAKDNREAKKAGGSKSKSVRGIHKLVDANLAGGPSSHKCVLLLCEGDSAKAGVVSGLSRQDRDLFGVYPMKGKICNTRGDSLLKVSANKEISEIIRSLGLEVGRQYTAAEAAAKLRYGKIVFMTDQDLDGSHIKGLGINLFNSQWHSLSTIPGFLSFMNTPILKAHRKQAHGKEAATKAFYSMGEFEAWHESLEAGEKARWSVKYYKGLGTSTGKEFREYFDAGNRRFVDFVHNEATSDDAIDMVFNKKRPDDRKLWLSAYNRQQFIDTNLTQVSYETFLDDEMRHFSKYDCDRSIPGFDGLKISQRKILFAAFKKNLTREIKVAQFSGYVSEVSGYHHGEASLNGAIVGMAQTFVGSNNVNLLEPNGQFGTRLQGGHDSASERYIFTQLNPLTRSLFMSEDAGTLTYLDDDGTSVEPIHYAPIIPMLLVNGSKGIGTGFSSDIICYNVEQIIDYVGAQIAGVPLDERRAMPVEPYYEGFLGSITPFHASSGNDKYVHYLIRGVYEAVGPNRVNISELPVGTWTDGYKEFLEGLIEKKQLSDYVDMSTDARIDITLVLNGAQEMDDLRAKKVKIGVQKGEGGGEGEGESLYCTEFEKRFRLYATQTTSNMHAFDQNEHLQKYDSVYDILERYHPVRLATYATRRQLLLEALARELTLLSNKARYILAILEDRIDMRRKKHDEVTALLEREGYERVDGDYKYLTKMPMDSVTAENVEALLKSRDAKADEHAALLSKSAVYLWKQDLRALKDAYGAYGARRREEATATATATSAASAAAGKDKGKGKGKGKQRAKKG